MAIFPKIQSPCPFKGKISEILDGEVCRLCKRQVFDLTHMSDNERVAFMKGCSGEVCVTYRYTIRPAVAAALATAALVGLPAAALGCETTESTVVVTGGGIKDPANAEYFQDASGDAAPNLPVVYEATASARSPATHESNEDATASAPFSPAPPS